MKEAISALKLAGAIVAIIVISVILKRFNIGGIYSAICAIVFIGLTVFQAVRKKQR